MEKIPCIHGHMESQSHPYGMGSAREYWFECDQDFPDDVECEDCNEQCPGYEAHPVACCLIHKEEFVVYDGCAGCEYDYYVEEKRLAEECYGQIERDRKAGSLA